MNDLPPASHPDEIPEVSASDFREEVLEAPVPVIVDFFAPWCGPCAWILPTLRRIRDESSDRLRVVKVDVDGAPELAELYRIGSVPTILLFRDGEPVDRSIGVEPERVLRMAREGTADGDRSAS